ncbi:1,4-alpha-glucan branching protein domain-containing protein [Paenibacillus alvei]|uniref:DUF1957 domain-containing protein n=1 Tax=Paenibacillus alvei TaxID=44250 RepID=A0AAP6ZZT4_PAEAL|nr:1,4-alpha-glucan branching protein domain-containing protein [Paenibacillus alvei]NOJ70352.1 DUF1957 domain-containing protein [Paenibacillus alvei]
MNEIIPTSSHTGTHTRGFVSLVLHAHLPYVRHPHIKHTLEERWFFEAMMETYLPLLHTFGQLEQDHIPFRLTMTLTPTLLSMMDDAEMKSRFEAHMQRSIGLAESEVKRLASHKELQAVAAMYAERWHQLKAVYSQLDGHIIDGYRHYVQKGHLECMTSAATHTFLPLIKQPSMAYLQLEVGMREHERLLGRRPDGIWLPECAYSPELDPLLQECGIRYFIVDHHGFVNAIPQPASMHYAPVHTGGGVFAFARDPDSSRQVWSTHEGYPGDYDYREYYRDIGFDLGWGNAEEWDYIRPHLLDNEARINTGLKYYRITGANGVPKEPYHPEWALQKAKEHARHFLNNREQQLHRVNMPGDRLPIAICPYDAELFGHWWFEGPLWIEALFREQSERFSKHSQRIEFVSPNDYLKQYPEQENASLSFCSWGRGGYADVWLHEGNDWMYPPLHEAEDRIVHITARMEKEINTSFRAIQERTLNQAITEWMLAASSDWAFIVDAGTVTEYAGIRTTQHLDRCHTLLDMIERGIYDQVLISTMENEYPCFPSVDYRLLSIGARRSTERLHQLNAAYPPPNRTMPFYSPQPITAHHPQYRSSKRILMIAWEFPPLVVGGLSRAVYDLSRHLSRKHCEIHVVTREAPGANDYEQMDGVHVYRVPLIHTSAPLDFMDWVFHMNAAISSLVDDLVHAGLTFDLIHAHDWLAYSAAADLKQTYDWPLVATIHATEHGRNHGNLSSPLQQRIHDMELSLTAEADHTIVCSHAMVMEVASLFALPKQRVTMIPNGVDAIGTPAPTVQFKGLDHHDLSDSPLLFYVGRLVYEKGIHILIEAMPLILQAVPQTKLIIAGTGPMRQQLEAQAKQLGLQEHILFAGFVQDDARDAWIAASSVCVFPSLYEPFGIVALEAMRFGTPVVVSDTGGLAEIIDHAVDGYKALPGHIESLAWHVTDLLTHPEHAAQMAARAQQKVQAQYDWNTIAVSTRQVYEGVIAQ